MSLVRDIPRAIVVLEETIIVSCSDILSTGAATTALRTPCTGNKTTGAVIISTGDLGDVVRTCQGARMSGTMQTSTEAIIQNRLRFPLGGNYQAVTVQANLVSTFGTTNANNKVALGVSLFHGDSSGGGDLVELSTGSRPTDRVFGSSFRTTDMLAWDVGESTGEVRLQSHPGVYDLRAAKKYLQVRPRFGLSKAATTETCGFEGARCSAIAIFQGLDSEPPTLDTTSPWTSSTSTE